MTSASFTLLQATKNSSVKKVIMFLRVSNFAMLLDLLVQITIKFNIKQGFGKKNMHMKIEIWWIGKTFQDFTKKGYDEFLKRIQKFTSVEIVEIADIKGQTNPKSIKNLEAEKILSKLKSDDFLILLDEKGKQFSSVEFADFIQQKDNQAIKKIIFLIGGAYGFDDKIYERANAQLSLSKMTYSHQLIRLIFMEQLYRAYTIINNFPYHNE